MAGDTLTHNYNWVKPAVGGDATVWGAILNDDLDKIDAQVYSITGSAASGGANIGDIKMFAGATPPANWKNCDGTVYPNTAIPALAPILANKYGGVPGTSNAVPDMRGAFPIGMSSSLALGAKGGEAAHTLSAGEMPSHSHSVNDPGHGHGVNDPQHFHTGTFNATGPGSPNNAAAGSAVMHPYQTDPASTGISIQNSGTGISINNAGSGSAHNNLPPYVCVNFIIKYQ